MGIESNPFSKALNLERHMEQDRKRYASELRMHILETLVKPAEYYQAGDEAISVSSEAGYRGGVRFRGEFIGYEQKYKASAALECLSPEIRQSVTAHGIGSNVPADVVSDPEKLRRFPLFALLQVLATGVLKGDFAPLKSSDGLPVSVFTDAPFILLSNKGKSLAEINTETGEFSLKYLRVVLVNGQYEPMIDRLRKTFPGVSFRTADEIDDSTFDTSNQPFESFEDMIQKKVQEKMGS